MEPGEIRKELDALYEDKSFRKVMDHLAEADKCNVVTIMELGRQRQYCTICKMYMEEFIDITPEQVTEVPEYTWLFSPDNRNKTAPMSIHKELIKKLADARLEIKALKKEIPTLSLNDLLMDPEKYAAEDE